MQQLALPAQEQPEGIQAGILVVHLTGLHGIAVQQAGTDKPQRAEVKVVADAACLVVDGRMAFQSLSAAFFLVVVGIDEGSPRIGGYAEQSLQGSLSQGDGSGFCQQQDVLGSGFLSHVHHGTAAGHAVSPENVAHRPARMELFHGRGHCPAVEVGQETVYHLSHHLQFLAAKVQRILELSKFWSVSVVCAYLLAVYLLAVDGPPGIDDVRQDEGHEQRDVEHGAQCELTRA